MSSPTVDGLKFFNQKKNLGGGRSHDNASNEKSDTKEVTIISIGQCQARLSPENLHNLIPLPRTGAHRYRIELVIAMPDQPLR
jgi:hypothetical protein